MTNKFLNTILTISVLPLLISCTRKSEEKSKITIQVPTTMTSQKNGVLSTEILTHIVLNVSGPGIEKIVKVLDRCHNCRDAAGNAVGIAPLVDAEVTQGDGRLFQILAVYESEGGMSFYYGDQTVRVSGASQSISMVVSPLGGGSSSLIQGGISGRIINNPGSSAGLYGPTGKVTMKYAPPGKPSLTIEDTVIVNGWFNFFSIDQVPFIYEFEDGTPLFGGPVHVSSPVFAPSNRIMRVAIPRHQREQNDGATTYWETEGPRIQVWGFFGDSSAISSKGVCRDFTDSLTRMKNSSGSALLTFAAGNPEASTLFQTDNPNIYYIGGEIDGEPGACDGGSPQYETKLLVTSAKLDGQGSDTAALMRPPLRPFGSYSGTYHITKDVDRGDQLNFEVMVLPDVENVITAMRVYKRVSGASELSYPGDSFPCSTAAAEGFELGGTGTVDPATREILVESNVSFTEYETGVATALCFVKSNGELHAQGMFLKPEYLHLSNEYNYDSGPATKLAFFGSPAMAEDPSHCTEIYVNTLDANDYYSDPLTSEETVTVSVTGSAELLDSNQSCADTGNSSLSLSIPPGSTYTLFKVKNSGTSAGSSIVISGSGSSLAAPANHNLTVVASGGMIDLTIQMVSYRMNEGSCKGFTLKAEDSYGYGSYNENGRSAQLSTNSDLEFFSDSDCNVPITQAEFDSAGESSVYLRGNVAGFGGFTVNYTSTDNIAFEVSYAVYIVPPDGATKVVFTPDVSNSNFAKQCLMYSVDGINDIDDPALFTATVDLYGGPENPADIGNVEFFEDPNCSIPNSQLIFNAEFSKNIWIQVWSPDPSPIDYLFQAHGTDGPDSGGLMGSTVLSNVETLQLKALVDGYEPTNTGFYAGGTGPDLDYNGGNGTCVELQLQLQDQYGGNQPNLSGSSILIENVDLTNYGSGQFGLYTDNTCTAPLGYPTTFPSFTILNGADTSTSGAIYVKSASDTGGQVFHKFDSSILIDGYQWTAGVDDLFSTGNP